MGNKAKNFKRRSGKTSKLKKTGHNRKKRLQKKNLKNLLTASLVLIASSCASVKTKDIDFPVCVEVSMSKAYCVHTVSSKDFYISETSLYNGKTWWEQRHYMLQLPKSSWAKIKNFILKTCKQFKKYCDENIATWDKTIKKIDRAAL